MSASENSAGQQAGEAGDLRSLFERCNVIFHPLCRVFQKSGRPIQSKFPDGPFKLGKEVVELSQSPTAGTRVSLVIKREDLHIRAEFLGNLPSGDGEGKIDALKSYEGELKDVRAMVERVVRGHEACLLNPVP